MSIRFFSLKSAVIKPTDAGSVTYQFEYQFEGENETSFVS